MNNPRLRWMIVAAGVLLVVSAFVWLSNRPGDPPKVEAGPQARTKDEPEPVPNGS